MKSCSVGNSALTFAGQGLKKGMRYPLSGALADCRWVKLMYLFLPCCLWLLVGCQVGGGAGEAGFKPLFDGQSLKGWTLLNPKGGGYNVTNLVDSAGTNTVIHCAPGGGGNLLTEEQYADFVLRFDFKISKGGNNGLAIRSPLSGKSLAYDGMELQILDNYGAEERYNKKLQPWQFHGALYDVVAPMRLDAQRPAGEWNTQEVIAIGRTIRVKVNGQFVLNVDLNDITDPKTLLKHPGLFRNRGHIGFLGHNDEVFFKNIRIKELPSIELDNRAPTGFEPMFNGYNLAGWQGVLPAPNDNPIKRAALTKELRTAAQLQGNNLMLSHWYVKEGELRFDGKGKSLSTHRDDYRNFEMLIDWKIGPKGDSGVYLRGTPQVQIWDPRTDDNPKAELGSGGLFNNKVGVSDPLVKADYITGSWNRFRICMIESRVHVFLNGQLVVRNTPLENYWDREQPIFPVGPIELQAHGNPLSFKNIYIREIK